MRLPVGRYCVIPSTFQPEMEGDFILRVHIETYGPDVEEESSDSDTFINHDIHETTALIERTATPTFSERSLRSELKFKDQLAAAPGPGSTTASVQGSRTNLARYKPMTGSRQELSTPVYGGRPEGRATPIYGSTSGRGSNLYGSRPGRTTPLYGSRLDLDNSKKY